ncbi:MAG: T9SS type A sorting domain-containing protein, partial [Bacteroidia bacterium]|nr:T9SS type A sorting domain-containing protein [Bacteroidia bacterium]
STVGYGTPTDLTTQPSNCTNWDGTIDGIISGESYSMVMPDDKSSGVKTKTDMASRIIIYPNPASGYISIQNRQHNYQVKAIDMTGRIIYLQPTSRSTNTQSFDVSKLVVGLYQILIEQNGVILDKQKIVINH